MRLARRTLAGLIAFGLLTLATGCGNNKEKIVGKWKISSMTDKNGKEENAPPGADAALFEFTSDGNMNLVVDMGNLPADVKAKMEQDKDLAEKIEKAKKGLTVGKYTVSGDTIEVSPADKAEGPSLFSKKEKAKLKIDGDTMTITAEDGTFKFTRVK